MLYKSILNLPFIDPQYVDNVYNLIKEKNKYENFDEFLDYFKDNYINIDQINNWNYFDNIENTTNNCCEAYNNKLNNYFEKKPTFFKLLYILREEEDLIRKEYICLITGIWSSKKKKLSDEKDIIVRYYEEKINDLKKQNTDEDMIIEEWYNC